MNELLGASLDDYAVAGYLTPIGFAVSPVAAGVHEVVPPSFRPDVTIEVDLVEEVARHHGYSNIGRTGPHSPFVGALTPYQRDRRLVREILVGAGVSESQTPSLLGPGDHARAGLKVEEIVAADAMIQEESLLRASLLPGLLRSLAFNAARRAPDVAFFEIGNVWSRDVAGIADVAGGADRAGLPRETERLAVALAGADVDATVAVRLWHELVAGLRLADVSLSAGTAEGLHPGRAATVAAAGRDIGVVGEVDPDVLAAWDVPGRVAWLDVDLRMLLVDAPRAPIEQRPVSRFPSADIDLAFVVPDDVPASAVEATMRAGGGEELVDVRLFDVFRGAALGAGVRSLAYRLRFNAVDRTLTDDELGALRARAIVAVESSTPARIRT